MRAAERPPVPPSSALPPRSTAWLLAPGRARRRGSGAERLCPSSSHPEAGPGCGRCGAALPAGALGRGSVRANPAVPSAAAVGAWPRGCAGGASRVPCRSLGRGLVRSGGGVCGSSERWELPLVSKQPCRSTVTCCQCSVVPKCLFRINVFSWVEEKLLNCLL